MKEFRDFKTITSYEIACKDQGLDPVAELPDVSKMRDQGRARSTLAYNKLCVIRDSIVIKEDGTIPKANFHDTDEEKWSNWMNVKGATEENPSGAGLSFYVADLGFSLTYVPARLLVQTEEQSEFFFEGSDELKQLWEEYILHRD